MVFVHHKELGFAIANCSEPLDGKEMPCKVEWIYFQLKIVHNAVKTKKMNGAYGLAYNHYMKFNILLKSSTKQS